MAALLVLLALMTLVVQQPARVAVGAQSNEPPTSYKPSHIFDLEWEDDDHQACLDNKKRKPKQVIVVGAGISGLAAARLLWEQGLEVLVLEARDRICGRIFTDHRLHTEMGAEWIHTQDNEGRQNLTGPVEALVEFLKIKTLWVGGDSTYVGEWADLLVHDTTGQRVNDTELDESFNISNQVWADVRRRLRDAPEAAATNQVAIATVIAETTEAMGLTPRQQALLQWHWDMQFGFDAAAEAEMLSWRWYPALHTGYNWETVELEAVGDLVVPEGYDSLCHRLQSFGDGGTPPLFLRHQVTSITYGTSVPGGTVVVDTNKGLFYGDVVLVTVPLGVLQQKGVRFDPPLPAAKTEAIQRLQMGVQDKLLLEFEEVFWDPLQYAIGVVQADEGREHAASQEMGPQCKDLRFPVVINHRVSHGSNVLGVWLTGRIAIKAETIETSILVRCVMDHLRRVYGDKVPLEPKRYHLTHWHTDEFARGSYSTPPPVGSSPMDMVALREPVEEQLLFAGEATALSEQGTVRGALVSGLREAARILCAAQVNLNADPDEYPVLVDADKDFAHCSDFVCGREQTAHTSSNGDTKEAACKTQELQTACQHMLKPKLFTSIDACGECHRPISSTSSNVALPT